MTNQAANDNGPDRADDRFAVKVKGNQDQINQLLREGEVDIGDHPNIADNRDGTGSLDAFLSSRQIETLRADGYEISVGDNLSEQARVRLNDVGKRRPVRGRPHRARRLGPQSRREHRPEQEGTVMTFLNVDEIESALIGLNNTYPGITQLLPLPNLTAIYSAEATRC